MPNKLNMDKVGGAVFGAVSTLFILGVVWSLVEWGGKAIDVVKPESRQFDHLVVLIDDKSPSIREGIILDGPQHDSLRFAKRLSVIDINEPIIAANGYNHILDDAGGAPAYGFVSKTGECKAVRMPTDVRTSDALIQKYMAACPQPLAAAPKVAVTNRGDELKLGKDDSGDFIDIGGGRLVRLAAVTAPGLMAGLPHYGANNPVFPESEWRPIDRCNVFDSDWILNQGSVSSCVGNAWAAALRRSRWLAGMGDVELSPAFIYALLHGGKDQGAYIPDGIAAMMKVGTCSFQTLGQGFHQKSRLTEAMYEEAKNYRIIEGYRCETPQEAMSALQTGRYLLVYAVMVGRTFNQFNKDGVCGVDAGPGNHAVMADGCVKIGSKWYLNMVNSWGEWGPWKGDKNRNGRALVSLDDHVFARGMHNATCAIRLPARTDKDPHAPPPVKRRQAANFELAF